MQKNTLVMKKISYISIIFLCSLLSLSAQLPAISGCPGAFCSQSYKYRLKTIVEQRSDTEARYTYTYDDAGYVIREEITTSYEADNARTNFVYNGKHQLVEVNSERGAQYEVKEQKTVYTYDEKGRLVESLCSVWVPENEEYAELRKQTYKYASDAATLPSSIMNQNRNLYTGTMDITHIDFSYNDKNKPIKIRTKLFDGYVVRDYDISYDVEGRILKSHLVDNTDKETRVVDSEYKYENNGNLLKAGSGDFFNFFEFDNEKSGKDTYYPPQFVDFFAAVGGELESLFFVCKIPYEGLAHQIKTLKSSNGADSEPEKLFDFEYEENKNVGVKPVLPHSHSCKFRIWDGSLSLSASEDLVGSQYSVYDVTGTLLSQGVIESSSTVLSHYPQGEVCIVSVGGVAYKVLM